MSESQAAYRVSTQELDLINKVTPELLRAIREVLTAGYGEVNVKIADGKICIVEKKITVKL